MVAAITRGSPCRRLVSRQRPYWGRGEQPFGIPVRLQWTRRLPRLDEGRQYAPRRSVLQPRPGCFWKDTNERKLRVGD